MVVVVEIAVDYVVSVVITGGEGCEGSEATFISFKSRPLPVMSRHSFTIITSITIITNSITIAISTISIATGIAIVDVVIVADIVVVAATTATTAIVVKMVVIVAAVVVGGEANSTTNTVAIIFSTHDNNP